MFYWGRVSIVSDKQEGLLDGRYEEEVAESSTSYGGLLHDSYLSFRHMEVIQFRSAFVVFMRRLPRAPPITVDCFMTVISASNRWKSFSFSQLLFGSGCREFFTTFGGLLHDSNLIF